MSKIFESVLKHPFSTMMLITCTAGCLTNIINAIKGKDTN